MAKNVRKIAETLGAKVVARLPETGGGAFGAALGDGVTMALKSPVEGFEFEIPAGVVPWLRACSRRWGWSFEGVSTN